MERGAFAITLRGTRLSLGISQAELARRVGTDQPTVSNWERGVTRPNLESIARLAVALKIGADELVRVAVAEIIGDAA